jgi:hypothetical protein
MPEVATGARQPGARSEARAARARRDAPSPYGEVGRAFAAIVNAKVVKGSRKPIDA